MSDVFSNAWSLLTDRSFIIPTESSIITFKVTSMNEGSGDWWVYGEDANFYYHFMGSDQVPYTKIARNITSTCEAFDPLNYLTWCQK